MRDVFFCVLRNSYVHAISSQVSHYAPHKPDVKSCANQMTCRLMWLMSVNVVNVYFSAQSCGFYSRSTSYLTLADFCATLFWRRFIVGGFGSARPSVAEKLLPRQFTSRRVYGMTTSPTTGVGGEVRASQRCLARRKSWAHLMQCTST